MFKTLATAAVAASFLFGGAVEARPATCEVVTETRQTVACDVRRDTNGRIGRIQIGNQAVRFDGNTWFQYGYNCLESNAALICVK